MDDHMVNDFKHGYDKITTQSHWLEPIRMEQRGKNEHLIYEMISGCFYY